MGPVMYPEVRAADPATTSASALHAVQVALDRRDNGGETAAAPGTPALLPARQ